MTDSRQLLAEYARDGSEAAFRELVTRYVDLVYSAANRLVENDAHRAQDVTQTVFADLARMAGSVSKEVLLGGWLHRHTCFVAANVIPMGGTDCTLPMVWGSLQQAERGRFHHLHGKRNVGG
jgi:Sigma-70 region 2